MLKAKFISTFRPSQYLSIDEMVGFKGRTILKQYMSLKPTKRGFQIWGIACTETAYLLSFDLYEGKHQEQEGMSLGEHVVLGLILSYLMGIDIP